MTGQVYTGQQGTGLATTLPYSKAVELELARQGEADKARAGERAKAMAELAKEPGEVWHFYTQERNKQWESWVEKGAGMMTQKGIDNPWKTTDTDAIKWQLEGAQIKTATENVNQYKAAYDKAMESIKSGTGKDYDPAYIKAVESFPVRFSYEELASGQVIFPTARFKNPSNYWNGFVRAGHTALKAEFGDVPVKKESIKAWVNGYFSDPGKSDDALAAQQIFENLSSEAKDKYKAKAELLGYDQPWQALAHTNLEEQFLPKKRNFIEDALVYSTKAPMDEKGWSKEDASGITQGGASKVISDKKFHLDAAKSHFAEYDFLLDDEAYMSSMGISMEIPRKQRLEQAKKVFAQKILDNYAEERSSFTRRDGRGLGDQEKKVSFDRWLQDIQSPDLNLANHAANYTYGTAGEAGIGDVAKAFVYDVGGEVYYPQFGINARRALVLSYKDEKAAKAAMEKYFDEAQAAAEDAELAGESISQIQAERQKALEYWEKSADQKMVTYPVTDKTMQILKRIHDRTADETKRLYQPMIKADPDGLLQKTKSKFGFK